MQIKSTLMSENRFASGRLELCSTSFSQDESRQCADLWPIHSRCGRHLWLGTRFIEPWLQLQLALAKHT